MNNTSSADHISKPVSEFVGREAELTLLNQWYASNVPLASIIGFPGVGKTSLVKEWCARKIKEGRSPIWYFDAAYAFLPAKAGPKEFVENLIRVITIRLGLESDDEFQLPLMDLASRIRQSGGILILDQLEVCLNKKRGDLPVGEPDEALLRFVNAFCSMSAGSGRMILTSNLRPAHIVEDQTIERKYVTAISGGETRDHTQLGGFILEDAYAFMRARLKNGSRLIPDDLFLEAYMRLEGHPKGMDLFIGLNEADQKRFTSEELRDRPLEANLRDLVRIAIEPCNSEELGILRLVALLRRPEQENYISNASYSLEIKDPNPILYDLQRRSLIEYGLVPRAGYSAHGIIRDFVHLTYPNAIERTHLALARVYESIVATPSSHTTVTTDMPTIAETAFHFHRAGKLFKQSATFWRDQLTRLATEHGKMAYDDENYESALESLNEYIKEAPNLVQTKATPRYLSDAYFNRAVTQHRKNFDWLTETADLRKSIELNSANLRALTFSIVLIYSGLKGRIGWSKIEPEIRFFVEAARIFLPSSIKETATCILIRLLVLWGDRVQDDKTRNQIIVELSARSDELLALTSSELEESTEDNFKAYIELLDFLQRRASKTGDSLELAKQIIKLATMASEKYKASSNLWCPRPKSLTAIAPVSAE